jgi:hypothetical protein
VSRTADPIAELIASLPSAAAVIAVTDDGTDDRFAPVRALAAQIAGRVGGNVVFCVAPARDTSPPRSRPRLFFPPVGLAIAGRSHTGTRSRDLLLAEARGVARPGLGVRVWLPSRHGPAGVAEAVIATSAPLVLVPARTNRDKILDRTLEYLASRVPATVVAVAQDGSWREVRALGGAQPRWTAPRADRSGSTSSAAPSLASRCIPVDRAHASRLGVA